MSNVLIVDRRQSRTQTSPINLASGTVFEGPDDQIYQLIYVDGIARVLHMKTGRVTPPGTILVERVIERIDIVLHQ